MLRALLVDDDPINLLALWDAATREGFTVATATCLGEAREALRKETPDLLVLDVMLPDGSALDLLQNLEDRATTEVVLLTAQGRVQDSLRALQLGASNCLTKPVDLERLHTVLSNVAHTHELKQKAFRLRKELRRLGEFGYLLGTSGPMQELYDQITKVAMTDATVLVSGESGTGKELVAHTLHQFGMRQEGPYIPVNCGAIPPSLIESELFGHEQGSFSGAGRLHRGYFERASGGSIFLDEVTEMPFEMQVKLLRVLEKGTFLRVGADHQIEADVRVIAATNRSVERAVADGRLREDLLYRLNVFPLMVPALRERGNDIELLAAHFLAELNKSAGTSKSFRKGAIDRLRAHSWPGNVRELKNVIRRAFILAEEEIRPESLPLSMAPQTSKRSASVSVASTTGFRESLPERSVGLEVRVGMPLEEVEKRLILATLDDAGGNKTRAARVLGISLRSLYNRLEHFRNSGKIA